MKTLADLSRQPPNDEEISQLFNLMEKESDRGCALVAGSFVEQAVYMVIGARLVAEQATMDLVFHGANAPLSTFSSKIRMGQALGMYGPKTAEKLSTIKDIRNAFAHALRPLDFTNPTIEAAVKTLDNRPLPEGDWPLCPARIRYIAICRALFKHIYDKAQKEGGKLIYYELP